MPGRKVRVDKVIVKYAMFISYYFVKKFDWIAHNDDKDNTNEVSCRNINFHEEKGFKI